MYKKNAAKTQEKERFIIAHETQTELLVSVLNLTVSNDFWFPKTYMFLIISLYLM